MIQKQAQINSQKQANKHKQYIKNKSIIIKERDIVIRKAQQYASKLIKRTSNHRHRKTIKLNNINQQDIMANQ